MRYQVPQFIDIEDRVFGPFTVKQFIYVAGGLGLAYIIYRFLGFYIGIIPIALVLALSGSLAFYKINGKPFIFTLEAGFKYFFTSKLYIWKKREKTAPAKTSQETETLASSGLYVPRLSGSKLKDLSWSLNINKDDKLAGKGQY